MREIFSRLLLSICLLLAQQGAVLHELHHLATGQTQAASDDDHLAAADGCSACHAFAQLGVGAAPDGGAVRPISALAFADLAWRGTAVAAPDRPPARSRGPPTLA
jgi:hypothetical protein